MSDTSVATALRSSARLVVIEAPAGCGKTFQGAGYARDIAGQINDGRVLILAHTHAACDIFATRTCGAGRHVDIRTIDSLISQIAAAYHLALDLPADTARWARNRNDGYVQLAAKTASLLRACPMIRRALSMRYPIVICDEHQDANADQHTIAMACHEGGALLRIFGDPMQLIYGNTNKAAIKLDCQRWQNLKQQAEVFDELDTPHRWSNGAGELGQWILSARDALRNGGKIDLRGRLPPCVSVIVAENQSQQYGVYSLSKSDAKPIYALEKNTSSLLVLATQNATVRALRAFFGRRLPIWEGHVRESLSELITTIETHKGHAANIVEGVVTFLGHVAKGFSPSAFGNTLLAEVSSGCVEKRRKKPATLQALGRIILEQPDHQGVANMLERLSKLIATDPAFTTVKIDYHREFWDAVRIGRFDDPSEAFDEILRRRTHARPSPPEKAISTVHKAKGLERSDVLLIPCDAQHFRDTPAARCSLYVSMSRAMRSLTIVVSRKNPSPLVDL